VVEAVLDRAGSDTLGSLAAVAAADAEARSVAHDLLDRN
jgi:hypothetical protein